MSQAVLSFPTLKRVLRFWEAPPTASYSLRLGVVCSVAIWLGQAPGLVDNQPVWILITVLMLVQPSVGASLMKSLLRAVGTLAGALTSILLFGLFSQDPPLLMAGFFGVQAIGAYGYSGSKFSYAWFVWAFTTAIVLGEAMLGQSQVETLAFQRASMVAIGTVLVFVIDSLFVTARSEDRLRESLAARASDIGARVRSAMAESATEESGEEAEGPPAGLADSNALAGQLALANAARTEIGCSPRDVDTLVRLATQLETLALHARQLSDAVERDHEPIDAVWDRFERAQGQLVGLIESRLQEVADSVRAGRIPILSSAGLDEALFEVVNQMNQVVGIHGSSERFVGRVVALRELAHGMRDLEPTLVLRDEESDAESPSWFSALRPDAFRTRVALRTGIAVVAAFVASASLGWPMNTIVGPITFMAAATPTLGARVATLKALFVALALAWAAADFAIVYLLPTLGRLPLALVVPFAIVFCFASFAANRPALAMLPAVGGTLALSPIFGGMSTPTNVYGTYSMVCYIVLALGVGMICGRAIFPATAAGLFRERLAAALELSLEAYRQDQELAEDRSRLAPMGHVAELVRTSAAQSAALSTLHAQALHEPIEQALDPSRRTEILVLSMGLKDAVVGDLRACGEEPLEPLGDAFRPLLDALRAEREELVRNMQVSIDGLRGQAAQDSFDLAAARRSVQDCVDALRADPSRTSVLGASERRRLLVQLDSRRRLVSRQQAIEQWLADWGRAARFDDARRMTAAPKRERTS